MYQRSWHGIPLASLDAAKRLGDAPAGAEFYSEFYAKLAAGHGQISEEWKAGKIRLGRAIGQMFRQWKDTPKVLAVACGTALVEGEWVSIGCDVTFNDCQPSSMESLKSRYPEAKTIVADARSLPSDERFDIITLITLDYALPRGELSALLQQMKQHLAPAGRILLYCASALNWRQVIVEFAKTVLGRRKSPDSVFWGWWRSPGEFMRLGKECGFDIDAFSHDASCLQKRPNWCRGAMSLRDTNFTVVYKLR